MLNDLAEAMKALDGKKMCSKAPYSSLIPLTQDTWMLSAGFGGGELDDDWDVLLA